MPKNRQNARPRIRLASIISQAALTHDLTAAEARVRLCFGVFCFGLKFELDARNTNVRIRQALKLTVLGKGMTRTPLPPLTLRKTIRSFSENVNGTLCKVLMETAKGRYVYSSDYSYKITY